MSDPAEQETPVMEGEAPDPGPAESGTPQVDYEKRYQDLRPQYDRTQTELQALRQQQDAIRNDPEAQRQFLAELGYDVATEPDEEPFDDGDPDPVSALEQRLAAIEAKEQQAEYERELQKTEQHFKSAFQRLEIPEDEQDAVIGLALTMPPGPDGMPAVEEAAKQIDALWEARQKKWAASKKTNHSFSPNGEAGTEKPNLDDPEQRQAWMAQRLADLNSG